MPHRLDGGIVGYGFADGLAAEVAPEAKWRWARSAAGLFQFLVLMAPP